MSSLLQHLTYFRKKLFINFCPVQFVHDFASGTEFAILIGKTFKDHIKIKLANILDSARKALHELDTCLHGVFV